ncbi:MAG: AMP-binding protein, partial [Geminicoccales bacterium]
MNADSSPGPVERACRPSNTGTIPEVNLVHLLLRSARWLPEQPAIAVGTRPVLTYGELALRVSKISSGLTSKLNLAAGDRVALAMKNCPEYHQILFACWHAGLTAVPMNAKLHAKEFAYILENAGAKACFVTPDLAAAVPGGISSEDLPRLLSDPAAP